MFAVNDSTEAEVTAESPVIPGEFYLFITSANYSEASFTPLSKGSVLLRRAWLFFYVRLLMSI